MGYGDKQVKDLETTINRTPCDTVIIGTPIDLNRLIKIKKPTVRVSYELQEIGKPDLMDVLGPFLKKSQKPEARSKKTAGQRASCGAGGCDIRRPDVEPFTGSV